MHMNAVEWILEVQKTNADRTFLIDGATGKETTFGELHRTACAIGSYLHKKGLGKGDRVAFLLNNSVDFVKFYFGCLYCGIVTVPINVALTAREIAHIAASSGCKLAVASPSTLPLLPTEAIENVGEIILLPDDGIAQDEKTVLKIESLTASENFVPFDGVFPNDTLTIVFTSGTTAEPKGVVHRIADLIDNARLFANFVGILPENRFYGILALTYLGGYYNLLLLPFAAQSSVVLSRTFDAASALGFWGPAIRHGVNTLWLVPTIMAILLEMDRNQKGAEFCRKNVNTALVGTAPLPTRLKMDFEQRYGIKLLENYGLSETLFISTDSSSVPHRKGSVGRVLPGVQVTVKDSEGRPVPYGEAGEVYVSSQYIMEGYLNKEKGKPEPCAPGAWFPTGDSGILKASGDLYVVGRKKDLIIRGGINISPVHIEDVISHFPAVVSCAVVGMPHNIYGEEIAVVVRLKEGTSLTQIEAKLMDFIKANLSQNNRPAYLFEIDALPLTSSGKVRKNELRSLLVGKLGLKESLWKLPEADEKGATIRVEAGMVRRSTKRPRPELIECLRKFPVSVVTDSLCRMNSMDGRIAPIIRGRSFCGTAVTVEEVEGGNLMSHIALELLQPGDVLVIDAKAVTSRASIGGLQILMADLKMAAGIVINGMVRDYEEIANRSTPVYAMGVSPGGPLKGWGGKVNYPISCAGVVVEPGDIVMGDNDGVVVVPQGMAEKTISACEKRLKMENDWFEKVRRGEPTLDVVGLRESIEKLGIVYE